MNETAARIAVTIGFSTAAAFSFSVVGVVQPLARPRTHPERVSGPRLCGAGRADEPRVDPADPARRACSPTLLGAAGRAWPSTMIVLTAVALWAVAQASLRSTANADA